MARNRYLAALRKWDWAAIKVEAAENLEPDDNDPDGQVGRSYLGSCLNLAPSRKYYAPFANRNLAPCPRCRGTGHAKKLVACERCVGSGWRSLGELAEARGESVEATVAFLGNQEHPVRINHRDELFTCLACEGGLVHKDCSWCGGIGSREAHLDQEWYEALDKVAEEHGLCIESGECDPCDLFAVLSVEPEEGEEEDEPTSHEPREPWQIPRSEYIDLLHHGKIKPPAGILVSGIQNVGRIADPHWVEVARAVVAGKPVPAETLEHDLYARLRDPKEVARLREDGV